jgi:hypothetical protein
VNDWFRSITALGAAFASVVVVTLALAMLIVSAPAVVPQPSDAVGPLPAASAPGDPGVAGIPGLGGELTVTGDLEGTFVFNRPADGPGYGLSSGDGRIFFDGSPLAVVQMNLDGLSFFPSPMTARSRRATSPTPSASAGPSCAVTSSATSGGTARSPSAAPSACRSTCWRSEGSRFPAAA